MVRSIEEKVEEYFKSELDSLGIRHYGKTGEINSEITSALRQAESKSGGAGNNYPDIQLLLEDNHSRRVPVMIEAKGGKNKLEKLDKAGQIVQVTKFGSDSKPNAKNPHKKGDPNYSAITTYATNGALHYGNAILDNSDCDEVIIMGINGTTLDTEGNLKDPEQKAYYISKANAGVPKHIRQLDSSFDLFKQINIDTLFGILDKLNLNDHELEKIKLETEDELEKRIKSIHQALYDDKSIQNLLTTNEKLYVFTGLIMAGLQTKGVSQLEPAELKGNITERNNDGQIILNHIADFLNARKAENSKINMIMETVK